MKSAQSGDIAETAGRTTNIVIHNVVRHETLGQNHEFHDNQYINVDFVNQFKLDLPRHKM